MFICSFAETYLSNSCCGDLAVQSVSVLIGDQSKPDRDGWTETRVELHEQLLKQMELPDLVQEVD